MSDEVISRAHPMMLLAHLMMIFTEVIWNNTREPLRNISIIARDFYQPHLHSCFVLFHLNAVECAWLRAHFRRKWADVFVGQSATGSRPWGWALPWHQMAHVAGSYWHWSVLLVSLLWWEDTTVPQRSEQIQKYFSFFQTSLGSHFRALLVIAALQGIG